MRALIRSLAAVALLVAAGNAGAQTAALPKVIEGADPAIWTGAVDSGPVIHRATGVPFPDELSGMKRFRLVALGGDSDVTANYRAGDTTFSVYLFRPGPLPGHRLPEAIAAIGLRSPQAFVWSDGPFDIDAPQKLRLFKGTYKTGIGPNTVMDYLYFAPLGTWTVKIRATLPSPKAVEDEQRLDAAVRALPWAAIARANGACTGTACQATRVMPFNHHIMEGMFGQILKASTKDQPATTPLLSARRDGGEWAIQPLDEKLAPLFTRGFGALTVAAPLYSLSVTRQGKAAAIVRFFSGTPDAALFERALASLERTPETSQFIPAAEAALHAPD